MEKVTITILGEELTPAEAFERLNYPESLEYIIKELAKRVLIEHYIKDYDIQLPEEELRSIVNTFKMSHGLKTDKEIDALLAKNNMTANQLVNKIAYEEKINRVKKVVISDNSVNEAFLKEKNLKDSVVFAMLKVDSEELATELFFRLKDDKKDFTELVQEFSIGQEKQTGGVLGPLPIARINPELRHVISLLKPGQISNPINLDGKTFAIIKLLKTDTLSLNTQIETTIRNNLFEKWLDTQLSLHKMHNLNAILSDSASSSEVTKL